METYNETMTLNSSSMIMSVPLYVVIRASFSNVSGWMAVILNVLNVIILRKNPNCFGEATTTFALAMAIIDATNGFCFLVLENVYMFSDLLINHPTACWVVNFFGIFSNNSSLQCIACVTFDRYLAVRRPLHYHRLMPRKRAKVISYLVVFVSFLVTLSVILIRASQSQIRFEDDIRVCFADTSSNGTTNFGVYILFPIFGAFLLLPVSFIVSANCYLFSVTFYQASRLSKIIPLSSLQRPATEQNQMTVTRQRRNDFGKRLQTKVIRTFLVISGVFLVIWTPTSAFVALVNARSHNPILHVICLMLLSCNSWTNAIVYFLMNKRYRTEVKNFLNF